MRAIMRDQKSSASSEKVRNVRRQMTVVAAVSLSVSHIDVMFMRLTL